MRYAFFVPRSAPLVAALVASFLSTARAAPPRRYGDPVEVASRSPLAASIESAARSIGAKQGLEIDHRLEAAMDLVVANLPKSGPPPVELSERALRLSGLVEPVPYLLAMVVPDGAEDDARRQAEKILPDMLRNGRYRRLAAATAPAGPGATRLVLCLLESFVQLAPIPRALPARGSAALDGKALPPYRDPTLFITAPDGKVERAPLTVRGGDFHGTFRCGAQAGFYQIEIAAEDRFGDTVLANFPVACGVPAPSSLEVPASPNAVAPAPSPSGSETLSGDVRAAAEARGLVLLQADRARAGLPPLVLDARLSSVARGHSEDMRDHGFFGHLSPSTGSAMDRLQRAGIEALRVRENLGRAYSPEELDRGLMGSPSHRANILSADVERVGLGIAVAEGGSTHDLYLTQLFAHLPVAFDAAHGASDLRARIDRLRADVHLGPFGRDPALDAVALQVARGLADGTLSPDRPSKSDPVSQALPSLGERYKWLRKVSGLAQEVAQFGSTPALVDREATHAGVAAVKSAAGTKSGGIFLVVVLAAKR